MTKYPHYLMLEVSYSHIEFQWLPCQVEFCGPTRSTNVRIIVNRYYQTDVRLALGNCKHELLELCKNAFNLLKAFPVLGRERRKGSLVINPLLICCFVCRAPLVIRYVKFHFVSTTYSMDLSFNQYAWQITFHCSFVCGTFAIHRLMIRRRKSTECIRTYLFSNIRSHAGMADT
jgi:hypothetical protein